MSDEVIFTAITALTGVGVAGFSIYITLKQSRSNTYTRIMDRAFELNKIELEHEFLFGSLKQPLSDDDPPMKRHYLFMFFLYTTKYLCKRKDTKFMEENSNHGLKGLERIYMNANL